MIHKGRWLSIKVFGLLVIKMMTSKSSKEIQWNTCVKRRKHLLPMPHVPLWRDNGRIILLDCSPWVWKKKWDISTSSSSIISSETYTSERVPSVLLSDHVAQSQSFGNNNSCPGVQVTGWINLFNSAVNYCHYFNKSMLYFPFLSNNCCIFISISVIAKYVS